MKTIKTKDASSGWNVNTRELELMVNSKIDYLKETDKFWIGIEVSYIKI